MTRARDVADTQDNVGGAVAPYVAGKNAVINGGFDIWQRGTSVSVAANNLAYTVDRWQGLAGLGAASTVSRQATNDTTNLPNIQYCARFQRNSGQTGTGDSGLFQCWETANSIPFAGKTVTFSFYMRAGANFSSASSAITSRIYTGTGTDQNVFVGYNNLDFTTSIKTLTTTWQRFSFTANIPSTVTEISLGFYYSPMGTAGANDYFEVTGVQLEIGSVATPFSRAGGSIGGELALCQRYYYRFGGATGYERFSTLATGASSTSLTATITAPTTMRVAPTSVDFATLAVWDGANLSAVTNLTLAVAGKQMQELTVTVGGGGITQYRPYYLLANNSTNAYLGLSAEL